MNMNKAVIWRNNDWVLMGNEQMLMKWRKNEIQVNERN